MAKQYAKRLGSNRRRISHSDRLKWGSNAKKGSEKWHEMSHETRVERRQQPQGNWRFEGKSPRTVDEIVLSNHAEVKEAEKNGVIKVAKNGAITPVKGKSHVRDGKLFYD